MNRVSTSRAERCLSTASATNSGSVVAADQGRSAAFGHEAVESGSHVGGGNRTNGLQCQALPSELVEHRPPLQPPAIFGGVVEEVVAPDVSGIGRLQSHATVLAAAEATSFPADRRARSARRGWGFVSNERQRLLVGDRIPECLTESRLSSVQSSHVPYMSRRVVNGSERVAVNRCPT